MKHDSRSQRCNVRREEDYVVNKYYKLGNHHMVFVFLLADWLACRCVDLHSSFPTPVISGNNGKTTWKDGAQPPSYCCDDR